MNHNGTLSAFFSAALLTLGGCAGATEKDDLAKALEATLATYGEAMRWGYFQTVYGYVHPDRRRKIPQHIDNLRIIGYEVLEPPRMHDEESAEQLVRIEYVHEDVQRLRAVLDRQLWRYDKASGGWWLESGIPSFE
ncbi:hypothetical protein [Candidatus Thiosymbion oneisti]|uniref:hypothetical protein n=1 Tax=Candidatus Thiosymbion oneisti TaxID=589554 RepID=UPI000B7D845E|nr:hypothetical protein [Candidatus Thiosymbion oneisti]